MAILAILAKMANLDGENGEKSPEGWQFKLDAKRSPLESGDFDENGKICLQKAGDSNWMENVAPWQMAILAKLAILSKIAKTRQRAGDIQNVANIQIGCQVAP